MFRWLQNHPQFLESAYQATHRLFMKMTPLLQRLGFQRSEKLIRFAEEAGKKAIFDCRMCGQCILHETGMTCSMTCPKNLRNGPCGGVRMNGHCEVIPEMRCVWVQAFERSTQMAQYGADIQHIQPPVNRQLNGRSAWITMAAGLDKQTPKGWVPARQIPIISEKTVWKKRSNQAVV